MSPGCWFHSGVAFALGHLPAPLWKPICATLTMTSSTKGMQRQSDHVLQFAWRPFEIWFHSGIGMNVSARGLSLLLKLSKNELILSLKDEYFDQLLKRLANPDEEGKKNKWYSSHNFYGCKTIISLQWKWKPLEQQPSVNNERKESKNKDTTETSLLIQLVWQLCLLSCVGLWPLWCLWQSCLGFSIFWNIFGGQLFWFFLWILF